MAKAWLNRIFLTSSLLLLHCVDGGARVAAETDDCHPEIRVQRNRTRKTFKMEPVTIHCIIRFCGVEVNMSWCKIDEMNECKSINETAHVRSQMKALENVSVSYLHFTPILLSNAGQYRCKMVGSLTIVSHSITIIVIDAQRDGNLSSAINTTSVPIKVSEIWSDLQNWLPYIYISAGISILLILLISIALFMKQRCQGSRHTGKAVNTEFQVCLQYNGVEESCPAAASHVHPVRPRSVRQHPAPHLDRASDIYDNVPIRTMSSKSNKASVRREPKQQDALPVETTAAYSKTIHENDGANENGDEQSFLLYATLNHKPARECHSLACASIPTEDLSEYAPIRVS